MSRPTKLKVVADYHQFHVRDGEKFGDVSDGWTVQATEDKVAVAPHVVGVGTASDVEVSVSVEVLDAEPALDLAKADHATEASLLVASGSLVVLGCTEEYAAARRLEVESGWWRVRILQGGLGKAREIARLLLWPAPEAPPRVLKRWAPPPPKKPKSPTGSPKNSKQAAALARSGKVDAAFEALARFANAGDAAAAASLAEIHAFRGEWAAFVPRAEALLADPTVVYAGNVFTDLTRLFRRAARELGKPEIVERAAARVPERFHPMRDATLLKDVVLPSENVSPIGPAEVAAYDRAVADARTGKRFAGRPLELARHEFALAGLMRHADEVLRLWQAHHERLLFDDAVRAARWVAHRGDPDEAWRMLRGKLGSWFPVAFCQVAPDVLLVDPVLARVMTPARCAELLATPRGPQAG